MKFLRGRKKGGGATLDITPLVDVVFLLNIFFLLTSSYFLYSGIKISVPKGVGDDLGSPDVVVVITHEGRVFVGNQPTPLGVLHRILKDMKAKKPDLSVLIRGDEDGRIRHLIDVYSACKHVGIENLQVQTRSMVTPPGTDQTR